MIKLSPRLQIIYNMVPRCDTVADVGCDHGYLTIALLQGKVAKKAIAMDVNKGPLESARINIGEMQLNAQVEFRLSDGLTKLGRDEADIICICGMGGNLIQRILGAKLEIAQSAKALILEPQSECRGVREYLDSNCFTIVDEELCIEEGKIYPIIKAVYSPEHTKGLSDAELEYGPVIIKKSPELFKKLLEKNKKEYSDILEKLEKQKIASSDSPIQKRKEELKRKLNQISTLEIELEDKLWQK